MINNINKKHLSLSIILSLFSLSASAGLILLSSLVLADSVVDEISITVPVSCTMSGTGMDTHDAEILNGTYDDEIGTTTLHASCNDNNGFAIYATGYTGDELGEANSNKLIGANTNLAIETGLATSAGNPDVSNWAMKLTKTGDSGDTTGTNAFTIDSAPNVENGADASFTQYHIIPNEYVKVAHKDSMTDMTESTGGAKFTTTYAAYISQDQPADTYSGQVIYTLVHPSSEIPVLPNQVAVNYHGNGLVFTGDAIKNRVVYEYDVEDVYVTVGNDYVISKTSNVDNDGNVTGDYNHDIDGISKEVTIAGADMLKIIMSFNATYQYAEGCVTSLSVGDAIYCDESGLDEEIYIDGNTVVFDYSFMQSGFYYAKIYPVYYVNADDEGAEYFSSTASVSPVAGTYTETTTWHDKWYGYVVTYEDCEWNSETGEYRDCVYYEDDLRYFNDENEVIRYIKFIGDRGPLGITINLFAYNPYTIYYDGNGATAGTMSGFYTNLTDNASSSSADLIAYNFKKTGYGFAGWSENPNTTVNGNDRIYGPNEKILGNELTFDNNRTATLYAVWVPSVGNLQNWSGCSSMASGQVTALTDTRDNNVYTVGKLADGNCWMMENLRLDATNSSDSTKAQGFGGVFTGLANSEDDTFMSTTANSKYNTSNITGNDQYLRFPRYNNNNTNMGSTNALGTTLIVSPGWWNAADDNSQNSDDGNEDHVQWYGYGNYYTWAAAMANTTDMNTTNESESANTSICPTGWSLPTSGIDRQFNALDVALGGTGDGAEEYYGEEIVSNRWRSYPNNFIYSGFWSEDSASADRGGIGSYWSRSVREPSSGSANYLRFSSWYIFPTFFDSKFHGFSVRCLTLGS